ncbi:PREDICTED: AP2/ERF and B3 domain-containing transcription factor At1g51120 [Tarenaya hassleriana]|uniref:AP2/ERF and B3 domain-containing transcription factor At1g51120 n=1 Tax=Tarenaya hassleriana TaxID=28532 RepID=UPI00053C24D4|nr:PREDICTED: AP2/ERF and B3 domain-containing transcription factor At1g51120 [Tarenaya hassleriana]
MNIDDTLSTVSSSSVKKTVTSGSKRKLHEEEAALASTASVALTSTAKYKGVVQQQNRHWGAQIYADHRRIWLGTFKTAAEAAMAYDSASIKLRSSDGNPHRNFPWTDITIHEPDFQECYTAEAVLNMIRDGSYQHKFRDFLRIRSQIVANINVTGSKETNKCFACTQLFQKELTPSDVGKLNRLVIPKKYAVKYLPYIFSEDEREDVGLVFYDREMRQWKFRYCYWRSSQSFVFTRGWSGFVKEKNLKEKDVIVFYTCDVPSNANTSSEGQNMKFLMIDVHYYEENAFVVTDEATTTTRCDNSGADMNSGNVFRARLDEEMKTSRDKTGSESGNNDMEENKGFRLFGVRIQ